MGEDEGEGDRIDAEGNLICRGPCVGVDTQGGLRRNLIPLILTFSHPGEGIVGRCPF
jgi:hypothetical protein